MVLYSVFALFDGVFPVPLPHKSVRLIFEFSPKSLNATMFRVLVVVPVLLVTHISTRFMVMPVVRLGNVFMASL